MSERKQFRIVNKGKGILNVDKVNLHKIEARDKHFRYVQNSPATTWVINHELEKEPSVTITDSAGTEVEGHVKHIDDKNLIITFSAGFSGVATMN